MARKQILSSASVDSFSTSKCKKALSRLFISIFSLSFAGAILIAPVSATFTGYFTEEQARFIRNSISFSRPRIDQTSTFFNGQRQIAETGSYIGTTLTSSTGSDSVSFYVDDYTGRFWCRGSATTAGVVSQASQVKSWLIRFSLNLTEISDTWILHMIIPAGDLSNSVLPVKVGYFTEEYSSSTRNYVTWTDLSYTYGDITSYDNYVTTGTGTSGTTSNYPGYYRTLDIEMPAGDFNNRVFIYLNLPVVANWAAGFLGVSSETVAHLEVMEQLDKIAVNQQTIINHMTTITVQSEEDAEEVQRILEKMQRTTMMMDEYEAAMNAADEKINLPDPENLVPDIHDIAQSFFDPQYSNEPLEGVFSFQLITTMLILSISIATVSYIVFGKKA